MRISHVLPVVWNHVRPQITRRRVIIAGVIFGIFLVVTPVVTYAYFARDIADRERLMNRNDTGIILRDKNNEVFYKFGRINGNDKLKLAAVADIFENAVIASEDEDFRKHEGYSPKGVIAALYSNLLNKDATRYGGSTITQQLVKNKLLNADKNFLRKYQEVSLAIAIERRYSKDEILEMYINSVYFGEGAFGITDAAKTYFNKTPQDLTLAESSMLVGVLPAPSAYSPVSGDKALAKQQQERVLNRMVESKMIDGAARSAALGETLVYDGTPSKNLDHAPHFSLMVLDELKEKYGEETMIRAGYDVTTSLDLQWQKTAEANARDRVQAFGSAGARNAGMVAIDPKNGQVRVLVGSADWNNPTFGKVNMAISPRQPGSSFKPIFYTHALDTRTITPATIIKDELKTYGGTYRPTNYDFRYRGNVTVRTALALSLNIPAVEVMGKVGVPEAAQAAQKAGLTTVTEPDKYGLSLALGTAEVKLYELANAYAAYANKGEQYTPTLITTIRDKSNNQVFKAADHPPAKKIVSPEASYLVSSILSDNQARAPTFGSSLTIPNRQTAVKTGTTNDNKDAWTIGYTPNAVLGVWMGNNENQPMRGLAGSTSAGVLWRTTMTNFLEGLPPENFERPEGIVALRVCTGNGLRAGSGNTQGTIEEFFIKGTEPSESCNKPVPKIERKKEDEAEQKEEKKEETQQEPPKQDDKPDNESNGGGRGGGNDGGSNREQVEPVTPNAAGTGAQ